jgi:hypothetical protein
MNIAYLRCHVLIASAALVVGCSSYHELSATPVISQSLQAKGATPSRPAMISGANSSALLYISSPANGVVYFLTYPKGKLVGKLTGFQEPFGLCSDTAGNVFIPDYEAEDIVEYAHGGTSPIAKLNDAGYFPKDCSIDPLTGNLAVANDLTSEGGPGNIAIYAGAQGTPTYYSNPAMYHYQSCAYDDVGNLFLAGSGGSSSFAKLPKGSSTFINYTLPFSGVGGMVWDGTFLAVGSTVSSHATIYRLKIATGKVRVKGTVALQRGSHQVRLAYFWVENHNLVAAFGQLSGFVGFWDYPTGGALEKLLRGYGAISVTISLANNPEER